MLHAVQRIYRRMRYKRPILVVSGLPRSGTSMTMKMLAAGGAGILTDELRSADEDNPKGYFELERVKTLDKEGDKSWLREARGKAVKIISFLLKDLPKTNNYKILFMHRNLHEIIASQNKMLARRGETSSTNDERALELFENHLWKVEYQLNHESRFEVVYVQYKDVLDSPLEQAERIRRFTGLPLDVETMARVVDESLYRNRRSSCRSS